MSGPASGPEPAIGPGWRAWPSLIRLGLSSLRDPNRVPVSKQGKEFLPQLRELPVDDVLDVQVEQAPPEVVQGMTAESAEVVVSDPVDAAGTHVALARGHDYQEATEDTAGDAAEAASAAEQVADAVQVAELDADVAGDEAGDADEVGWP